MIQSACLIIASLLVSSSMHSAVAAVFETDKRLDYFEIKDPSTQALGKSVFTFILKSNLLKRLDGRYEFLHQKSLSEMLGLCANERFGEQPSVGTRCSGFLVAADLGVTAGHCVSPLAVTNFCENYFIVFDYRMISKDEVPLVFDSNSIFECKEIVKLAFDPNGRTDDYAVLRFSRQVKDRQPLKYRKEGQIGDHDGVFMLGYPRGLPEKISPDRNVTANHDSSYFSADVDCFHGNSGSPVFNSNTLEVEGIFVRGEGEFPGNSTDPNLMGDFYYSDSKKCYQTLVCRRSEGCTGTMDSTRMTRITW